MKNLLKIIASVVLFVFASCEQESLENFDGSTKNQRTIKKVTYEEMSKNQKLLDKLSSVNSKYNILYNNAKLVAASDGSFYIDTNLATYVEESNGYHSYTFQIFRDSTAFYLENLVLNYSVSDSAYSVYLIQYDINEQEYQDIISGVADNSLKSKIFLTQLDDNVINTSTILSKNGNTSYCPNCGCASFYDGYIFNGINDDGSIDWLEHICPGSGGSGGTTSSSGSSESPTVGSGYVPGYGIGVTPTPGSVNTNGLLGGGNNTPNTKPIVTVPTNLTSTDGANATVSYLVNLLSLNTPQATWLNHNTQVANQILNFLSQNNSSQESKEFVNEFIIQCINNPNLHLDFEASLKSPSFVDLNFDVSTPEGAKLKEVNDALMTSSEFRRLFYNLFSEIPQLSVKLTIGNIDQSNAVGYIYGNCHSVYNTNSLYMYNEITIDRQGLLTKSKMNIALFVLHEYIHAYLNVKFRKPPIGFSISQINSMDFVNCVNTYYNGFSGAQSQHNFFVDFMIPTIVEILSDIKNILITSQEASQIENPIDGGAILYQPMNGNPLTPSDIQIPWNWNTFLYYFSYQGLQNCSAFPFSIYPNLITSGDYYYHWYNGCYNTIFNP
ncbi:hypothetical protein Q361_1207 [Flavobacterium croceum DSM 17960]|uniref:Uncharacterized protein n=1 Tax=Flavobacterium croceum DSM 17960 TaxID=1121886 RepID=A0A2S4N502_9FLAO|nr:hypothetical protein [Flavobacterium croceum]POS00822.1 hypothetical protein Q361_1207 [Flavobacterium croceum DSM 17960]